MDAAARRDLREAIEAGEVLVSYATGFSENRAVAEAKETLERLRAVYEAEHDHLSDTERR